MWISLWMKIGHGLQIKLSTVLLLMKAENRTGYAGKVSTDAGDEKEFKQHEDGSTILKDFSGLF